ncbi:unnamed protein product [Arabidopsis arenosa]|uniref:Uncharacterized protein n=1 Tax=Arabidopsis arenosa TaxID=38785 RepID=A0A8S1ZIW7_ARAAE|nr:unnamed protein product [Arabidopsis arenosa]
MMMRFLGNNVAKSCRMGRLQYRGYSSAAVGVTTTTSKKIVGYCFKGAFLCVGIVLGGVTSSPVAKQVQETEEMIMRNEKFLDEQEAMLEG